jgi:NADP-dependent 3-hydroxy acid dehydrogenase YdfG
MTLEETAFKLADVEHRAVSNTRRIDKLEQQTDAIQSLATSVEVMVTQQAHQTEAIERIEKNVEKLDGKVEVLEQKPAKRWESVIEKAIISIVSAIMAFLLAKLGLG